MTLPKLDIPTFDLTVPSTKKKLKYRPFLVKEHKTLLMMKDAGDDEISRIVQEIVDICTFNKLKGDVPSFDIEYIFAKIRAKSIGEKVDLIVTCRNCENKIPFKMDIDKLDVQMSDDHSQKVMITDSVGVEMKYPKFNINLHTLIDEGIEKYFSEIGKCIKAIYTTDGKYFEIDVDDAEELDEFLSSMTSKQFEEVENFFLTMPKLSHSFEVSCDACGTKNKARVEGLSNFFV
jgi:hypothetical protein